jgi:hypothetical protein
MVFFFQNLVDVLGNRPSGGLLSQPVLRPIVPKNIHWPDACGEMSRSAG